MGEKAIYVIGLRAGRKRVDIEKGFFELSLENCWW